MPLLRSFGLASMAFLSSISVQAQGAAHCVARDGGRLVNQCAQRIEIKYCEQNDGANSCANMARNRGVGGAMASLDPGRGVSLDQRNAQVELGACYAPASPAEWKGAGVPFKCK